MKESLKERLYRKLDDQAKVFAWASNKKYSSIFRLSVVLKESIDANLLQEAVKLALEKFQAFKVKMKKGVFSYYFIGNELEPVVKPEKNSLFRKVNTKENNKYLFRTTYVENRINMEFFHALTDGNGASKFLKEVIYRYLELKHPENLEMVKLEENEIIYESENAYVKNYKKNVKKQFKAPRAHQLSGEEVETGKVGVSNFNINLPQIKECTKIKDCSLSMYLSAMIAYSIYEGDYKINKGNRPINLCLPISLQKYFGSETLSNFFSYMILTFKFKRNRTYTFENVLEMVKSEFEKKFKLERIVETMSNDAAKTRNPFVRAVPLVLKKAVVRLGSLEVKRHFTMTISNIGKFDIQPKYSKYVENATVTLAPDWAEKMKCGICSYGDNLVVSFGTYLKNSKVEKVFKELLEQNNIKFGMDKKLNYLSV